MDIKTGEVVSIRHYSGIKLFKSIVVERSLDNVTIKIIEEIESLNCLEGDPIVLGFESENEIYIASCNIVKIKKEESQIVVKFDNIETLANKRISERYPVSFYADIRIGESQTKHLALVKNISFTGILIYSKIEFPLYQKLKISINIGVMLTLNAVVVRRLKETHNIEYGLKIVYNDVTTPNLLKRYLLHLKKEQSDFINKYCKEQTKKELEE